MAGTFNAGDVVTTKAGRNYSPVMVVKWTENNSCLCIWYNSASQQFEEYKFPTEAIMPL